MLLRNIRKINLFALTVALSKLGKQGIFSLFQLGVLIEDGYRLVARELHYLRVGSEVGDVQLKGVATLLCAVNIPRAT